MRNLAATYGDLATAMEDAAPAIRGHMNALRSAKHRAESEGYVLRTGDPGYSVDFDKSKAHDKNAESNPQTAFEWHSTLKTLGKNADRAVTTASTVISGGLAAISGMSPASIAQNSSTIDPTKAASDVRAIQDGTATPEQRARFLNGMRLTPGQIAALNRGEQIQLSPEQMKYMRLAAGAVDVGNGHVRGIDAFDHFVTNDPAVRAALANGLRTISNENVHSAAGNGNFATLPQSFKNSLTREDLVRNPAGPLISLNGVKDNAAIGRLLAAGDPKYAAGSEVDKRVVEVARQYTQAQNNYEQDYSLPHANQSAPTGERSLYVDGQIRYDSQDGSTPASAAGEIQDMLRGGGMDKIAVHDAFQGSHGQEFIHDLMTTQWTDDGDAAGSLTNTTAADAKVANFHDPNDVYTSRLTGETMLEVAKYAHTHEGWEALKNIPNTDGQSVGQLNPKLLQTLSTAMAPYADDIAGRHDPTQLGFNEDLIEHSPGKTDWEGASRIYALFGGDPTAAHTFYGQAATDLQQTAEHWAQHPNASGAADDVALIGHLRGVLDEGIAYSAGDVASDQFDAATKSWQMKHDAFGQLLNLVPDKGPADVAGAVKDQLLDDLIGKQPDRSSFNPDDYAAKITPDGSQVSDLNHIRALTVDSLNGDVRSQVDPGWVQDHSDWFNNDGSLKSVDEIGKIPDDTGERAYSATAISSGVDLILRQITGHSNNSSPQDLINTYNDVTQNSTEKRTDWPDK